MGPLGLGLRMAHGVGLTLHLAGRDLPEDQPEETLHLASLVGVEG